MNQPERDHHGHGQGPDQAGREQQRAVEDQVRVNGEERNRSDGGIHDNAPPQAGPVRIEEDTIASILGRDDPRRMKLTREELEWARDVKDIIEGFPDIDDLSDYMCAQLAIITKGNMEEVVQRAHGLQDFCQEYKVLNSYEEGCRYLQFMIREFPLQFMSWSFSEEEGTYVLAHDAKHFDTTVLTSPDKVRNWMKASYYIHTSATPDFATIRKGHIVLIETEGVDWTRKQDFKLLQKMFAQLLSAYPFRSEMRHYHTGMIMNLFTSMLKRFLNQELRDSITMGLQHESRLDQIYMVPDVATANERLLSRLQETLRRRYDNEKSFKLADC